MTFNRRKKIAVATGMSAVAAMAVVGGTLAQFTDQDAADTQILTAGTVVVAATEGAGWNTNLDNLAIGDTAVRDITISNAGTLPIQSVELDAILGGSVGIGGSPLSDIVTLDVWQDDALPSAVNLATGATLTDVQNTGLSLQLGSDLAPGATTTLTFYYSVDGLISGGTSGDRDDWVNNPDNAYQQASLEVDYTVSAVQRAGIDQPVA